jgi:hypothetical protein
MIDSCFFNSVNNGTATATATTTATATATATSYTNIGSFYIHHDKPHYTVSHVSDNGMNHPMYQLLYQSFQTRIPDIAQFIYNKKSVVPLSNIICDASMISFSLDIVNLLFQSMYSQICFLLKHGVAISFIDINDIMVINGNSFYFCNYDKLYHIKNGFITITDFYDLQNPFLPPELINNNIIPFTTYYTSSFYSLAIIILYCFKKISLVEGGVEEHDLSYKTLLNMYQHTKIYFTLKYCLVKEPTKRSLHMF